MAWRNRFYKLFDKDYRVIVQPKSSKIVIINRKSEATKYKDWHKLLNQRLDIFLEGFYCETIEYNNYDFEKIKDFIAKIEEIRSYSHIDYYHDTTNFLFYIVSDKNYANSFYNIYPQFKGSWNKPAKQTHFVTKPKKLKKSSKNYGFNEMLYKLSPSPIKLACCIFFLFLVVCLLISKSKQFFF